MNYYERHLGDYARDTGHLSILEHGAYTLLLDRYYSTEKPIPADQVHRVARARGKDEIKAVNDVLAEFFSLVDGAWSHARCDAEIAKKETKTKAAQANGRSGGRPKKKAAGSENITQEKPTGLFMGSENETQTEPTEKLTRHQTPDTSNQSPEEIQEHALAFPARGAPVDPPSRPTKAAAACIAMRSNGLADCNPSHPELLALIDGGAGGDTFADAAAIAVAKGKGFGYALGIVKGRMADAANLASRELSAPRQSAALTGYKTARQQMIEGGAAAIFDEATHV